MHAHNSLSLTLQQIEQGQLYGGPETFSGLMVAVTPYQHTVNEKVIRTVEFNHKHTHQNKNMCTCVLVPLRSHIKDTTLSPLHGLQMWSLSFHSSGVTIIDNGQG